ncbi:MAG: NUDIX domain-containing protein [Acidimicrobiales bacterium]
MSPPVLDDAFTRQLVAGSHAEGVTRLAVAAVIEVDERVLLVECPDDAHFTDTACDLPTGVVLPGETLLDAVHRVVATTTWLEVDHVTGYLGR